MDDIDDPLQVFFADHVDLAYRTLDSLFDATYAAVDVLTQSILSEHRIFVCGNGRAGALGQIFCAALLGRIGFERPALPAMHLGSDAAVSGSIGERFSGQEIFSRQLQALGHPGDSLLLVAGPGNIGSSLVQATRAAHDREMRVIALTAEGVQDLASMLERDDIELRVPSSDAARVQECHLLLLNTISAMIERRIFGLE
jgi:D-sedoheptulose 7-phosphate isomerase